MGGVCNQVEQKNLGKLEINYTSTTKTQYEEADLAEQPFFKQKLQEISKENIFYTNFEQNRTLMRHKTKDLFYLGDWSQGGYPQGKGVIYAINEYVYYGDFDSVPHGDGVLQSISDKYIYQGDFYYGKIEGKGKVTSTERLFQFEGTFNTRSEPCTGVLSVNNPNNQALSYTVTLDNYPENKARIAYNEGRQYQGQINFHRFVPHGRGIARYNNNSTYEGEWENGQFHGRGTFTWSDGSQYTGGYEHGKKHGTGRFIYPSRKVYEGEWRNGKQDGRGTLFDADENVLKKGYWQNGHYTGQQ